MVYRLDEHHAIGQHDEGRYQQTFGLLPQECPEPLFVIAGGDEIACYHEEDRHAVLMVELYQRIRGKRFVGKCWEIKPWQAHVRVGQHRVGYHHDETNGHF